MSDDIRLNPEVEEGASEGDRIWFEGRPCRRCRLRSRIPGELAASSTHAMVYQLTPGVRLRHPLSILGGVPNDDDGEMERLMDLIGDGQPAYIWGGRVYSLAVLPGVRHA